MYRISLSSPSSNIHTQFGAPGTPIMKKLGFCLQILVQETEQSSLQTSV